MMLLLHHVPGACAGTTPHSKTSTPRTAGGESSAMAQFRQYVPYIAIRVVFSHVLRGNPPNSWKFLSTLLSDLPFE